LSVKIKNNIQYGISNDEGKIRMSKKKRIKVKLFIKLHSQMQFGNEQKSAIRELYSKE